MRLRYKMWILIFTIAIMLIGLGTFSMLSPSFVKNERGTSKKNDTATSVTETPQGENADQSVNTQIADMVKKYFRAKQQVDMKKLKQCVSDVSQLNETKLSAEAEYIEDYRNIQCTIIHGLDTDTYRVYVYYDAKVYDIDTLIPSLSALYVKKTSGGTYKVYMGSIDAKSEEYIEKLDKRKDIIRLQQSVQKKLQTAMSSDKKVREFYEMLESANDDNQQEDNENIDQEGQSNRENASGKSSKKSN